MISLVVNVVPLSVPPQVPFSEIAPNPSLGDNLKLNVLPEATGIGTLGETAPFAPAVGVTRYVTGESEGVTSPADTD
jgi:hypothetical protein